MSRYLALVPAAGVGSRFGAGRPKQYVEIDGRSVLEHTLRRLLAEPQIERVAVVVSPQDGYYAQAVRLPENLAARVTWLRCGGESRADSVFNGLNALLAQGLARPDDCILVHDAARCCLPHSALRRLLDQAGGHPAGGILALPVADTLKRAGAGSAIAATVSRKGLWQAQTPQLFRADLLQRALSHTDFADITDEASAVERLGVQPLLVAGDSRNLKMTLPQDEYIVRLLLAAEQAT